MTYKHLACENLQNISGICRQGLVAIHIHL